MVLAGSDGAVELRVFAAPRNGDLWSEARPADRLRGRRGTAAPPPSARAAGAPSWSAGCRCSTPDGKTGTQESRIIGINGPRWMLRATLLGKPATDLDGAGGLGGR